MLVQSTLTDPNVKHNPVLFNLVIPSSMALTNLASKDAEKSFANTISDRIEKRMSASTENKAFILGIWSKTEEGSSTMEKFLNSN